MRTRTAAITLILVASAALVTTASAAPGAATLPAASSPYRLGFAQPTNAGLRARAIFSTAADGSDPQQATNTDQQTDDTDPAYSPDGTKVAYASSAANPDGPGVGRIMLADANGANARPITSPGPGQSDDNPTWSPDGTMIAFERLSPPSIDEGLSTYQLYVAVLSVGIVGPLIVSGWAEIENPYWSPTDPDTIVAVGIPNGDHGQFIVRISLLGTGMSISADTITPLVTGNDACRPADTPVRDVPAADTSTSTSYPTISPDGGTVAYENGFAAPGTACLVAIDGTNPRPLPISNLTFATDSRSILGDLAFSPDGTQLAVEVDARAGAAPGTSILDATLNGPPATATSATQQTWIQNAAMPAFDVQSGPVSLTVAADPAPGYVGGHVVAVTFTLKNQTSQTLTNATLAATLPAVLLPVAASSPTGCQPASCPLGNVAPGATVVATFDLTPVAAVSTLANGTVTSTNAAGATATVTGHGPLVVFAPKITPNPAVGPPGIVTVVTGIEFPPHAKVRFTWKPGITAPTTVKVKADGTFTVQVLVLPHDDIGSRLLTAHGLTGAAFGDATAPFLVQSATPEPPRLVGGN